MSLKFLSVCSGIEAASCAWGPLGWEAVGFSEIEPFPCAVLAHHHPHVPNFGDMTKFYEWPDTLRFDVLAGGTPCQGFSLAGLRKGLDDPRSQLSLHFVEIAARYRPRWVVWENVPGVLSSEKGADFAAILGAFTGRDVPVPENGWSNSGHVQGIGAAYGVAWRVLDAQHFGVPQRRRRVFLVGYLGDWRRAAAVLFERHSLSGNPPPRREPGQGVAGTLTKSALDGGSPCGGDGREGLLISQTAPTFRAGTQGGGGLGTDFDLDGGLVAATLDASFGKLQGCSGQDLNHGHSHLVPDIAPSVTSKWAKGSGGPSGGPSGDECQNLLAVHTTGAAFWQEGFGTLRGREQDSHENLIAHTLRGEGFDASEDGTGRGTPLVPVAFNWQGGGTQTSLGFDPESDVTSTLQAHQQLAIAFSGRARGDDGRGYDREPLIYADGTVGTLDTVKPHCVATEEPAMAVRRLTPRECERLQGFPDDHTRIPSWNGWRAVDADEDIEELRALGLTVKISKTGKARVNDPDGPRYKALGNSWAVPCARWIGERISLVEATF